MTTVNDFTDILRIIREQPEWGDALRSALLSQKLLELPERFAEFTEASNKRFAALEGDVAELKAGQARLEGDVAELKAGQARLESDVAELKAGQARLEGSVSHLEGSVSHLEGAVSQLQGDVGNMRGTNYETRLGKNIDSILGQRLDLRGTRLIKGSLAGNNAVYLDLIDAAGDRGDITEQEHREINETDFVLRGRSRIDQSTVFVVVEASVIAGDSDINRAADRAAILEKATGDTALPAVVCDNFDSARQRLAEERNVTLVTIREQA